MGHGRVARLHRGRRPGRSLADQRARAPLPRVGRGRRLRPPRSRAGCCGWRRHRPSASTSAPAAPRPLDQDAICFLLAEKAREGRTVVRLKWGDPFVFDSGGKEALFLHEQGIPFEVVPGHPGGDRRTRVRRRPGHLPRCRRCADVRARPRGRDRCPAGRGLGDGSRESTERSSATQARGRSARSATRCGTRPIG